MKIKCLREYGISLKKDKIYEARQGQLGWFAFIDETGEEYAYPPHLFEVMDDSKKDSGEKSVSRSPRKNKPKSGLLVSASGD